MSSDLILQLAGGFARTAIASFGAYLGTVGITVTGAMQDQLLGAAMVLVSLGWSGMQKWWAERAARGAVVSAAVASARHGEPVSVSVTSGDQPNIAVRIPQAEQNKADTTPAGIVPTQAA